MAGHSWSAAFGRCVVASVALFWVFIVVRLARWKRLVDRIESEPDASAPSWPRISIIVPARDEGSNIEAALHSLLSQDYPDFEIVAIDDRSADATGRVMDRLAAENPRLKVLHIENLPGGWLGKNNANHRGALLADGSWLLFTDGDVTFAPGALRRAMTLVRRCGLGHLAGLPRFRGGGYWERAFVSCFCVFAAVATQFWNLSRPRTRAFIGPGVFNLVRRADYQKIGGHERLRMEVVDDVKLGLLLRRNGVPQGAFPLGGAVSVRWQNGFLASMRGLVKNMFAGVEWRWSAVFGATSGIALVSLVPLAAFAFAAAPSLRLLCLPAILLPMILHGLTSKDSCSGSGLEGFAHPITALLFIGVMAWSALSATRRRGISWRGTFYSLPELKAGCVRESDWPVAPVVGWTDHG